MPPTDLKLTHYRQHVPRKKNNNNVYSPQTFSVILQGVFFIFGHLNSVILTRPRRSPFCMTSFMRSPCKKHFTLKRIVPKHMHTLCISTYLRLGSSHWLFFIEYLDIIIKHFNSSPSTFIGGKLNWKAVLPV